ncbi:MAG: hypothetical protein EHM20_12575 [Alphaproteobacteria bacterium]|nr:MAG: hypothetical protein EHM20_12575 [Alphaproteobacteria bacterium]
MKNLFIMLLLLSFNLNLQAQPQYGRAKVLVIGEDIDTTELAKEYVVEKPAPSNLVLPNLNERDIFFEGIIFPEYWDDLKKDIFYVELKSKSLDDLIIKYPDLKVSDIKMLKGKK